MTERPNHARELCPAIDVNAFDAIVCISGDGLIHEVLNGLAERPDAIQALQLPIAMIPSGMPSALFIR